MKKAIAVNNSASTSLWSLCAYFGAILALFLMSNYVFASSQQDLGTVSDIITKNLKNVSILITAGSYVAGVAFALMGMLKFKAHKDNPTQVPLSQPLVLLAIAAGLVFLPSIIGSAGATVWGAGTGQSFGASGQGGDTIGK